MLGCAGESVVPRIIFLGDQGARGLVDTNIQEEDITAVRAKVVAQDCLLLLQFVGDRQNQAGCQLGAFDDSNEAAFLIRHGQHITAQLLHQR